MDIGHNIIRQNITLFSFNLINESRVFSPFTFVLYICNNNVEHIETKQLGKKAYLVGSLKTVWKLKVKNSHYVTIASTKIFRIYSKRDILLGFVLLDHKLQSRSCGFKSQAEGQWSETIDIFCILETILDTKRISRASMENILSVKVTRKKKD